MREEVRDLRREGQSVRDIARQYGLPESKVARWVEGVVPARKKPTRGTVPKVKEKSDPGWLKASE